MNLYEFLEILLNVSQRAAVPDFVFTFEKGSSEINPAGLMKAEGAPIDGGFTENIPKLFFGGALYGLPSESISHEFIRNLNSLAGNNGTVNETFGYYENPLGTRPDLIVQTQMSKPRIIPTIKNAESIFKGNTAQNFPRHLLQTSNEAYYKAIRATQANRPSQIGRPNPINPPDQIGPLTHTNTLFFQAKTLSTHTNAILSQANALFPQANTPSPQTNVPLTQTMPYQTARQAPSKVFTAEFQTAAVPLSVPKKEIAELKEAAGERTRGASEISTVKRTDKIAEVELIKELGANTSAAAAASEINIDEIITALAEAMGQASDTGTEGFYL